jgi:outer membrane receptor protein involved in Fe transport
VVTAAKTGTRLSRYAGTASIIAGADLDFAQQGRGSDALMERVPSMSSTHLGSGRNKLFIRGIADSSFNGPSQALVGQYLGDVRLNYNAPDPDLSLYDVQSVEVIEGPQGTLYGAGSLAGVMRIVPQPVAMGVTEASLAVGRSFTASGAPGYDVMGVLNVPLGQNVAARVVAFRAIEGGYIDDWGRGVSNVNRTRKRGGRAVLRAELGDWHIEFGAVIQDIATRDGQYADIALPPLTRSSRIAQPFDNDYLLGSVTITRNWGGTSLVSATSALRQNTGSRYDFTPLGAVSPRIFEQRNRIRLFSNETRLSHQDADGRGWVVGGSILQDDERLTRAFGSPEAPTRILGVDNSVTEWSAFGEWGIGLTRNLIATVGGRIEYDHLTGRALGRRAEVGEPRRNERTFLPSLSLSWRPGTDWLLYGRYQEGFRPGGLSVTPTADGPVIQRFHGDNLASSELGAKWRPDGARHLDAAIAFSHAQWDNIQADLVNMAGLPFTQNIGSGRIWGAEATVGWRPIRAVKLSAALFANDSRLTHPAATVGTAEKKYELPNVAHIGATGRIAFTHSLRGAWRLDADARASYVGHSRLGVGPQLDLLQGNYVLAGSSVRVSDGRWGLSLDADNLLNSRGTLFALGNPFGVSAGRQSIPPRPRTIRIGMDVHF